MTICLSCITQSVTSVNSGCYVRHICHQVLSVNVERDAFDSYYNGCCNGTFWPLFHSMPDRAIFKAEHWQVCTA